MLAGLLFFLSGFGLSRPMLAVETVRVAIPGKLIDFAALYAGARLGIYRQEGIEPQFVVMRSGIIIQALLGSLERDLSYEKIWRARRDLNPQPTDP